MTEVFKDEAGLWSQAKSIAQARPEVDHFARLPTSIAMTLQMKKGDNGMEIALEQGGPLLK